MTKTADSVKEYVYGSLIIRPSLILDWNQYLEESKIHFELRFEEVLKSDLTVHDFILIQTIALGRFSHWIVCQMKMDKNMYLLDVRRKEDIVKDGGAKRVFEEKQILQAIDFPFCTNLLYSFQDNANIYKCMPLVNGGSLLTHLKNYGKFDESSIQFFAAQIILALEYLHYLGILYRNLTPENVFLDQEGYVKLIGFYFSKRLQSGRTYTVCGTKEYLSPEALKFQGYGLSADWWALGVLLFELATGQLPFTGASTSDLLENILSGRYRPLSELSLQFCNLVSDLLEPDLTKRCGRDLYRDPVGFLKNSPCFKDIDWLALLDRQVPAPFVPCLSGPEDLSLLQSLQDSPLHFSEEDKFSNYFENY